MIMTRELLIECDMLDKLVTLTFLLMLMYILIMCSYELPTYACFPPSSLPVLLILRIHYLYMILHLWVPMFDTLVRLFSTNKIAFMVCSCIVWFW